jgi:hypothetical protein
VEKGKIVEAKAGALAIHEEIAQSGDRRGFSAVVCTNEYGLFWRQSNPR